MRPIKLTLECFGSYLEKQTIDFNQLGKNGLYLITGDTGSGKTTIFDAILFALYGCCNGSYRKPKMLRSKNAPDGKTATVELIFEFRGKEYTITREAPYTKRDKNDPNKIINESGSTLLLIPGENPIKKPTEATNRIKSLLGIDSEQFCKIAMIAQGNFRDVIFAKSSERVSLFRTLFRTEKYQKLEETLSKNVSAMSKELSLSKVALDSQIKNITCDNTLPIYADLQRAQTQEIPWDEKLNIINNIVKLDEDAEEKIDSEKKKIEKRFQEISLLVEECRKKEDDLKRLETLKIEIEEAKANLENKKENLVIQEEAYNTVSDLKSQKTDIDNQLPRYDELDIKIKKISELTNEIKNLDSFLATADSKIEAKEKLISDIKREQDSLKDADVNKQKLLSEKEKCEANEKELNSIKKAYETLKQQEKDIVVAEEEYIKASKKAIDAASEYSNKNKAYLDEQAGILASKLVENTPCPVCGSLSHPSPCALCKEAPTKEDVKKAQEKADKENKNASEKSNKCSSLKAVHKTSEENLLEDVKSYFREDVTADLDDKISGAISENKANLTSILNNLKEEEEKALRKENLEKQLPIEEKKLDELKNQKVSNNEKKVKAETELTNEEENVEKLKKELKFSNKKEAQSAISKLMEKIDKITKTYTDAKKKVEVAQQLLDTKTGTKSEVENRINTYKVKDTDKETISIKFDAIQKEKNENEEQEKVIVARLRSNKKLLDNINKDVPSYIKTEKQLSMITLLSNTFNGNLPGMNQLKLETYVQMAYFDRVIYYANKRLEIMTNGKYTLRRREEAEGNNVQFGLDLDVTDHHTGLDRNVQSLSGGESFQASLALALGLSDEVCNSNGGIKLDTMFIDEGFGTLDHEAMQKAFEALVSVSEDNKLVGIISHVDYLKEHVEQQIVVSKDEIKGSKAKIHRNSFGDY